MQTLKDIEAGNVEPVPQVEAESTHVGMLKKEMGNLDWSRPARELKNYVRGLNPWPAAYSFLDGKMLKIWTSEALSFEEAREKFGGEDGGEIEQRRDKDAPDVHDVPEEHRCRRQEQAHPAG